MGRSSAGAASPSDDPHALLCVATYSSQTFWEAEYESSADIEARFAAALKDPDYKAVTNAWFSHIVDGESRDYVLSEVVE